MADLTVSANVDTLLACANNAAMRSALGLTALATTTPGTGVAAALAANVGSAGALVVNGGALGTPSSGTLTNCTGLPSAGVTGLGDAATKSVGTGAGSVAAGDHNHSGVYLATAGTAADVNPAGTSIAAALSGKLSTSGTAADVNPAGTSIAAALGGKAASAHSHEGTAILSTGESGGTKFLREDGDGTSSWQSPPAGGATNIWIPAAQMIPRTTAGCGVNSSESTTNDQNYDTVDFDAATDEGACFQLIMPNNWGYGTITFQPVWTADSGSGTACFALSGVAIADDGAIDTASGTAQTSTDTLITAGDVHVGPASNAITVAGTPAANKIVFFTLIRDVSEDTLDVDARLLGIQINFT